MTLRNSHPVLLKENFGPCRSVLFNKVVSKNFLFKQSKCSGTAHRKSVPAVIVGERVHVAVAIELQVARVAGAGRVRRSTPREPPDADFVQLSGLHAAVRIRTAQSRSGSRCQADTKRESQTATTRLLSRALSSQAVNPRAQRTGKPNAR